MRPALLVVFPFAFLVLVGCGGEKPAEVSGTVLLDDGAPLPEGEIIFLAADNSKSPEAGPIKDGKYSLTLPPGAKKVRIQASRPASKSDPAMGAPPKEAMLGPEYNEKSTLTADIKPGKNEGVDFKVKALPKRK